MDSDKMSNKSGVTQTGPLSKPLKDSEQTERIRKIVLQVAHG